jgi:hypothetical protein
MLLKQVFKSVSGAQRRAAFENAHSTTHRYTIERCLGEEPDKGEFSRERYATYTWRIRKEKRDENR